MLPTMRQLEVAGACGSIIVWVLTISIMAKSIANGLPQLGRWATAPAVLLSPAPAQPLPLQQGLPHACMCAALRG